MKNKKIGTTRKTKKTTTKTKPARRPAAGVKAAPRTAPSKAAPKRPAKPAPAAAGRRPPKPAKSAKSPFNKKEMEPYRRMLLEMKAKLIREVLVNQEASNESADGEVLDLADQAADSYDRDLANSLSEAERGRLASVEHALKRVAEGVYGLCDACSRPIPLARLRVLPFAKLCVPCQQGEEGNPGRRLSEA